MIQTIRGFRDILPGEVELWQEVETTARTLLEAFGFKEIRLPVLEKTELFARGIGADTDIVEKEMFTFADRKGDMLTLRPEATASVVRAYIEHGFGGQDPVQKWFTIGPMFRRERPQKGRYRQFYQINAEMFGVADPRADVQLIRLCACLFGKLQVPDVAVRVNTLGCPQCRVAYKQELSRYLAGKKGALCENCQRRLDTNPLRVLDCKVPECREAVKGAPGIRGFLCPACEAHFQAVLLGMDRLDIAYTVDPRLVRGLDYYTRTTFEVQTGSLGAQNAVAGGGRYDGLVAALGGPDTPGLGFAIGFDRLVELLGAGTRNFSRHPAFFLAALGNEAQDRAFQWLCALAQKGVRAEMDFENRSLKSQMKQAGRMGAARVLIVGQDELASGRAILRDMETKNQQMIPMDKVVETLAGETTPS